MTYVIAEPCVDTLDQSCVSVCPVDCIHFEEGVDRMLFIDPDECIDCGACEPECPWQAIFEEVAVPDVFKDDTPLNYKMVELSADFEVAKNKKVEHPTAEQVAASKKKWGWE
jgi:ferredoxin